MHVINCLGRIIQYITIHIVLILGVSLELTSCKFMHRKPPLFKKKEAIHTNIFFSNNISHSVSMDIRYYYRYSGGGVGVGDFNNDGKPDLLFGGNIVSSKLYLNEGKFQFNDVTSLAGLATHDWITGITLVDINQDGWLDIYLNTVSAETEQGHKSRNLLFVNQGLNKKGIPTFDEKAMDYGLASKSNSIQSAFFDYDRDGDLDMFLMTNIKGFKHDMYTGRLLFSLKHRSFDKGTVDKLYENIGTPDSLDHPYFENVSKQAGIHYANDGLGLAIDDVNEDGWPDVYIASDLIPNDLIYINQQDGTFKESAKNSQNHQSRDAMGVDIADLNNDLLPDIITVDMLPKTNEHRKSTIAGMNFQQYNKELGAGYIPQFSRNTVQLNRGADVKGTVYFSDISQLTGMDDTNWSWAPLIADFDNDGLNDVFVTNGFFKNIIDLDFIDKKLEVTTFGSQRSKKKREDKLYHKLPGINVSNYMFRNNGRLSFTDKAKKWGLNRPSYSNGAVYADLDNDGDLDLVTNNINEKAFVYKNYAIQYKKTNHYLKIKLHGSESNTNGLGAKVLLYVKKIQQYRYKNPIRGYLSSMNIPLNFGVGHNLFVDSLKVYWPDGKYQIVRNIAADQTLTLSHKNATFTVQHSRTDMEKIFNQSHDTLNIRYKQIENSFNDFKDRPMLPKMYSRNGPGIAVGDADHKNGQDFFIGGTARHPGTLFLQQPDGTFRKQSINKEDAGFEDMGALFFDIDNDGDQDLYVVSGGSEFAKGYGRYQDRMYINDGTGKFVRDTTVVPETQSSGSCVVGADYDRDGDIDLFVGGGYNPGAYPIPSASYLWENKDGILQNIANNGTTDLRYMGMVSSAVWSDFNNDSWVDLIVVGEWMSITFYENKHGQLVDVTNKTGLKNTNGWWNSICPTDINNDGNMDYIVGNFGTNNEYKPGPKYPIKLFAYDYDKSGTIDPVLAYYHSDKNNDKVLVPYKGRDDFIKQLPILKSKFRNYQDYAREDLKGIIPSSLLSKAEKYEAETVKSSILINQESGHFLLHPLPIEAQFSPVNGILTEDFNHDGNIDLLLSGNLYVTEATYGRQDASLGLLLLGNGKGDFEPVAPNKSGLFLDKDMRGLTSLYNNQRNQIILAATNSDSLTILSHNLDSVSRIIYAQPQDAYAIINYKNGRKRKTEFNYGAGYLSQSSRAIKISKRVESVEIIDFQENKRTVNFN